MRKQERSDWLAIGAVVDLVEKQMVKRTGLRLGVLRVLVRLGALVETGALVRGVDVANAQESGATRCATYLVTLRRCKLVSLHGGGVIVGHYVLEQAGRDICQEYAGALRRASASFVAFESASPFRRLGPAKSRQ